MRRLTPFLLAAILSVSACNEVAQTPEMPSSLSKNYPIALQKIAEGVWVHTSNYTVPGRKPIPSNGLIVEDGDNLIMVDTAWGEKATESLLETVKSEIGKPVTKVVITHHHLDKIAGVDVMEFAGAEVFTHPLTPVKAANAGYPVPNTSVAALKDAKSRTKVGPVEIAYPGAAHAQENLVVYIPSKKILYGGCAIKGAEANSMGNLDDADIKAWPTTLNWIKTTYPETQTIVPGHGKGSDLRLIDRTLAMIAKKVNADNEASKTKESEVPAKP